MGGGYVWEGLRTGGCKWEGWGPGGRGVNDGR